MMLPIFLGSITVALLFVISFVAAPYGQKVTERFLERGKTYSAADLKAFVTSLPDKARGYAFPVLFPWDLLFAVCFGSFLGVGSMMAVEFICPHRRLTQLSLIGPALYVVADFVEDAALARMLLSAEAISPRAVSWAQRFTKIKLFTCGYSLVQTIALSGAALLIQLTS